MQMKKVSTTRERAVQLGVPSHMFWIDNYRDGIVWMLGETYLKYKSMAHARDYGGGPTPIKPHNFKPGQWVVRLEFPTTRFKLGKAYLVQACPSDEPRHIFVLDEGGVPRRSNVRLYEPAPPTFQGETTMSYDTSRTKFGEYCAQAIPCPPMAPSTQAVPADLRRMADAAEKNQAAAATAEAARLADQAAKQAVYSQVQDHLALANATIVLLQRIQGMVVDGDVVPTPNQSIAKHRKALAGLAESYGVKIVLVGDKTHATLVRV